MLSSQEKNQMTLPKGVTLIELLLVLFVFLLLTQFAYSIFPKTTETEQVEMDMEEISNMIFLAQQYAITHQKIVVINCARTNGFCKSYDFITKQEISSFQPNTKITPMVSMNQMQIKISSDGSFSKSESVYFYTPVGNYRLVLLLGQGRFYYEKM